MGKDMYRITKVLNHNAVICVTEDANKEYLIMGKGIGFGKKITERIETNGSETIYSLQSATERGDARKLATSVDPICLEIANEVLDEAERVFQTIDRDILFPLADHIEYAVKRIQNHEQISNPLTDDIRILFYKEFKVADMIRPIIQKHLGVEMDADEVGYVALHIHSAIQDEKVSQAMQMARAVRECITLVEKEIGKPIDVLSLSYNRLMNHVRNMVARAMHNEQLKLNMNDYMGIKFPQAFETAKYICDQVGKMLKCSLSEAEIGYLAMHIERVTSDELESKE